VEVDRRHFVVGSSLALSGLAQAGAGNAARPATPTTRRRIATEEAFTTPAQTKAMLALADSSWPSLDLGLWRSRTIDSPMISHLSLEGDRLRLMDQSGIAMQVLSLTSPGVQMFDADLGVAIAEDANDRLAEHIRKYKGRYAGLATFTPQAPKQAVKEMERAISRLGLNGFICNSHTNGEYLDDAKYWPILEAAEALDRPIYIHPRSPSDAMTSAYGKYGLEFAVWGFQAEVGLHAMRLILGGVFDRFPRLKIIIGHMGENVPFHLGRSDTRHNREHAPIKRKPSEYFLDNFYITTSGVTDHLPLKYCIEKLGADKILWAVDYPYEFNQIAVDAMDAAPISEADREAIYFRNAERVFRIT